jgi:hypothetical protein
VPFPIFACAPGSIVTRTRLSPDQWQPQAALLVGTIDAASLTSLSPPTSSPINRRMPSRTTEDINALDAVAPGRPMPARARTSWTIDAPLRRALVRRSSFD